MARPVDSRKLAAEILNVLPIAVGPESLYEELLAAVVVLIEGAVNVGVGVGVLEEGETPPNAPPDSRAYDAVVVLRAEVARLRAITGSDCPKCGKTIKGEHERSVVSAGNEWGIYTVDKENPRSFGDVVFAREGCTLWASDLVANHPAIAREMGVSE